MIKFIRTTLDNGLKLLHYYDSATRMVALNLTYNVGSKHESPQRTGLAHLMEHLMFTGSANVPDYDAALQQAGGSNNAWTSCDMTNYYEVLPAHNIETGLWVESDRLLSLTLSDESIRAQKDEGKEESKQRCLNEPYGDLVHLLQSLAYTRHHYAWPTIGKSLSHIETVTREEILRFYKSHYSVDNLVMCIAGNITFDRAVELVNKWFGDLSPAGNSPEREDAEPVQADARTLTVKRDVPQRLLLRAYHMPGRNHEMFPACDLLSDVLSNGRSSRFHQNIMSRCTHFTELDASIQGTIEPGLFIIRARLAPETSFEQAQELIDNEIAKVIKDGVSQKELDKCLNKFHSAMLFDNISYQEKAMRLCEYELLGNASLINEEVTRYRNTSVQALTEAAAQLFDSCNSSSIYYDKTDQ